MKTDRPSRVQLDRVHGSSVNSPAGYRRGDKVRGRELPRFRGRGGRFVVEAVEAVRCGGYLGEFSLTDWHGHTPQLTEEIGYPQAGKELLTFRFLFASGLDDLAEFAGVLAIEGVRLIASEIEVVVE